MKNFISILIISTSFLMPGSELQASNINMGRIKSVHPYGALDAALNPSLLSWQKDDNAIGLLLNYQPYTEFDASIKKYTDINFSNLKDNKLISGAMKMAYTRKINVLSLGINFTSDIELQNSKAENYIYDIASLNHLFTSGTTKEETYKNTPTMSLSLKLTEHNSIGLKIDMGHKMSTVTEKYSFLIYMGFPMEYSKYTRTRKDEDFSLDFAIGFLQRLGKSEIGLMVSSGNITWMKSYIKETNKRFLGPVPPPPYIKLEGKIPTYMKYTVGPSFTAGVYTRPLQSLGASLETEIVMPIEVDVKNLEFQNYLPFTSTVTIKGNPTISLRGGFEIFPSHSTILSMGGGLLYHSFKAQQKNSYGPFTVESISSVLDYYITAGADYIFSSERKVTLGLLLSKGQNVDKAYAENILFKIKDSKTAFNYFAINCIIAVTIGF